MLQAQYVQRHSHSDFLTQFVFKLLVHCVRMLHPILHTVYPNLFGNYQHFPFTLLVILYHRLVETSVRQWLKNQEKAIFLTMVHTKGFT